MDHVAIDKHQAFLRNADRENYAPLGRDFGKEGAEVTLAPNVIVHVANAKEAKELAKKLHAAIAAVVGPYCDGYNAELKKAVG